MDASDEATLLLKMNLSQLLILGVIIVKIKST